MERQDLDELMSEVETHSGEAKLDEMIRDEEALARSSSSASFPSFSAQAVATGLPK